MTSFKSAMDGWTTSYSIEYLLCCILLGHLVYLSSIMCLSAKKYIPIKCNHVEQRETKWCDNNDAEDKRLTKGQKCLVWTVICGWILASHTSMVKWDNFWESGLSKILKEALYVMNLLVIFYSQWLCNFRLNGLKKMVVVEYD